MLLYIVQVGFLIELPVQRRLCSILLNLDFSKWNTTVWYRVTRYSQAFRGLMGDQRTPGFWGVTKLNTIKQEN